MTSPSLPLDILQEIAARSDPVSLMRCAATCKDLRRHISGPAFRRRPRPHHRLNRFLPSLLRGILVRSRSGETLLVDAAAATSAQGSNDGGSLPGTAAAAARFPLDLDEGEHLVTSRGGLVLLRRALHQQQEDLRVCCPATGRVQALHPGPTWRGHYVLLAGGDDDDADDRGVGRRFQVLKACLVLSDQLHHLPYLYIQSFSSELGAWNPLMEMSLRDVRLLHGFSWPLPLVSVDGAAVHWLCATNSASYILTLHGGGATTAHVSSTKLPTRFHRSYAHSIGPEGTVLATAAFGGSPVVLVADRDRIWMWERRGPSALAPWLERPQVVMEKQALLQFTQSSRVMQEGRRLMPRLECFSERSGLVLVSINVHRCGLFLLDLGSREIVRWFSCSEATADSVMRCPYEIHLSSWVPTLVKASVRSQAPYL